MQHFINNNNILTSQIDSLLKLGTDIAKHTDNYKDMCKNKILATLFYEPSTRTRLSFESAMLRMGGSVLGFSNANSSSAAKGESVADTIRMIGSYADICAIRHPQEGAPMRAGMFSSIPVINAGDGSHLHPTQTLTDLMTVLQRKGTLSGLKICFCGDLKYGRTVHSLLLALSMYKNNSFVFVSPPQLKVPQKYINEATMRGVECIECETLEDVICDADILYMTRIQKERFPDVSKYEQVKDCYILTADKMTLAKKNMAVLHPLPRVNEIAIEVDSDDRAAYFEQAQNGVYVRMALILALLNLSPQKIELECSNVEADFKKGPQCLNRRCITNFEEDTHPLYILGNNGKQKCIYCESTLENTE